MADDRKGYPRKIDVGGIAGPIWLVGYLFTLGFLHLNFTKGFLALVLWPYYLGAAIGKH